jgi:hypothetical protein
MADGVTILKGAGDAAGIKAISDVINKAIGTSGDILKELIRTAQTNPAVGVFLVMLLCDVFTKIEFGTENPDGSKGLLSATSSGIVKGIVVSATGITLAAEVLGTLGIGDLGSSDKSIIIPTVTTLVNSSAVDPASAAELGKQAATI